MDSDSAKGTHLVVVVRLFRCLKWTDIANKRLKNFKGR